MNAIHQFKGHRKCVRRVTFGLKRKLKGDLKKLTFVLLTQLQHDLEKDEL